MTETFWRHWRPALIPLLVFWAACTSAEGDESQEPSTATEGVPVVLSKTVNVETRRVEPEEFTDYIRVIGEARAFDDIVIAAEEQGRILRFRVEKGDRVRAGEEIARLDAAVLSAQTDEARASSALAREQYERQRRLWEDEGIGSEIAYLQARYQAEIAAARLATLEARLAKTVIRAPVTGVFEERYVDPGEIALPGARVGRLVAVDRIRVMAGVPERYGPLVRRGTEAVVQFDVLPDQVFEGTISYVGSTVDDNSRTFPIEIVLVNPEGAIKPAMVANVQFVKDHLHDVIVVSQDVVKRSENGFHVYVVRDAETGPVAEERTVTLGPSWAGRVVVTGGLAPGEALVTRGAQLVDNESRLTIVADDTGEGGES